LVEFGYEIRKDWELNKIIGSRLAAYGRTSPQPLSRGRGAKHFHFEPARLQWGAREM